MTLSRLTQGSWLISLAVCSQIFGETNSRRIMITESIDDDKLVTLAGNTRPELRTGVDQGAVPDSFVLDHLTLQLKPSPQQQAAFEIAVGELQDPRSLSFHKWMTADEIGRLYGISDEDLATTRQWMESRGLLVNAIYPNHLVIDFSATAGQIKTAFHTSIHRWLIQGQSHIANLSDPRIPAALAPVIAGVTSLHDFRPRPMGQIVQTVPDINFIGGGHSLGPGDLAIVYNLNPLYDTGLSGQGQSIAVLEDSDLYSIDDWYAFRRSFGLTKRFSQGSLTMMHPGTSSLPCLDPGVTAADREATLDAEVATGAAPNASIVVAACANTFDFGGFIAMRNLLSLPNPPSVMSISYGDAEASLGAARNLSINLLYLQAAAEGVSVFVSSGDWGGDSSDRATLSAHGLSVSGFASTPWNVAVGGTDFADTLQDTTDEYWATLNTPLRSSALSYIPEITWDGSCASQLLAGYNGFAHAYGSDGYCSNLSATETRLLTGLAGSGGPSSCATGTPQIPEVVGGTCAGQGKPSWQQNLPGNPDDGVRDLPDVSLFASPGVWGHGYAICFSDPGRAGTACTNYYQISGGTSASSPLMAGIQALINQSTGGAWGNPNPVYYALARDQYASSNSGTCNASLGNRIGTDCTFHDITLGDTTVVCQPGAPNCFAPSGAVGVFSLSKTVFSPAYSAAPGWDFATGIGSVDASNLVSNWLRGVALTASAAQ